MFQTDKDGGQMKYSEDEIMEYVLEEDVKFIRLAEDYVERNGRTSLYSQTSCRELSNTVSLSTHPR